MNEVEASVECYRGMAYILGQNFRHVQRLKFDKSRMKICLELKNYLEDLKGKG
jgi:hypothetical protein